MSAAGELPGLAGTRDRRSRLMRGSTLTVALLVMAGIGTACAAVAESGAGRASDGRASDTGGGDAGGTGVGGSPSGQGGSPDRDGDLGLGGLGDGSGAAGEGGACAVQSSSAELQPVHLSFAFDVSGSMGKGDKEWHDRSLKWEPVVAATKQFFSDASSEGLTASLTFFPAESKKCQVETYATPDVPPTPLPSPVFGEAIDAITPVDPDDWRGDTPTAWVVRGTLEFIEAQRRVSPGKYAIVLVTDGYPQGCDKDTDTIAAVVKDVGAALADDVSTYVIGVANPPIPGAPNTVSELHEIAAAGGTGEALLIDTGDPSQTTAAFRAAIERIRRTAVSCTLGIPPAPDGRTFDKEKVQVSYTGGAGARKALVYDQSCATADAWRYDDPASPSQIVLCAHTCEVVQTDVEATLSVDFTCERVIEVPL